LPHIVHGVGIMMLAVFAIYMEGNIHEINAVKAWLGVIINLVASVIFLIKGMILLVPGAAIRRLNWVMLPTVPLLVPSLSIRWTSRTRISSLIRGPSLRAGSGALIGRRMAQNPFAVATIRCR